MVSTQLPALFTADFAILAKMLRKYFYSLALTLLFVFGQQGSLLHEISHYGDYNRANQNTIQSANTHAQLSANPQQQDKAPHSPLCEKCLGYAQVAGTVASSLFALPLSASVFIPVVYKHSSHSNLTRLSYSARAPPLSA